MCTIGVAATTVQSSVIIPIYNQLKLTRVCLGALFRHAPSGTYEVIAVDNGSTDGVSEWLAQIALEHPNVRVIHNRENLGFAAACNQGLAIARGEGCLLLNNDVVMTSGALEGLWAPMLAAGGQAIGLTGPVSNFAGHEQTIQPVTYDDSPASLEAFATARRQALLGQGRYVSALTGFCLLIHRRVIERIGGFDRRFGLGYFEDNDYCLRASLSGFRLWVCDDVFVHHFGSQTMLTVVSDLDEAMAAKERIFKEKWRIPEEVSGGTLDDIRSRWPDPLPILESLADRSAALTENGEAP